MGWISAPSSRRSRSSSAVEMSESMVPSARRSAAGPSIARVNRVRPELETPVASAVNAGMAVAGSPNTPNSSSGFGITAFARRSRPLKVAILAILPELRSSASPSRSWRSWSTGIRLMRFSNEPNPPLRSKSVPRSAPAAVSRWFPASSPELSRDAHGQIPVGCARGRSKDQIDLAGADGVDPEPDRPAFPASATRTQPPVAAVLGVGLEDRPAALDVDAREVDRAREQLPQVDLTIESIDAWPCSARNPTRCWPG